MKYIYGVIVLVSMTIWPEIIHMFKANGETFYIVLCAAMFFYYLKKIAFYAFNETTDYADRFFMFCSLAGFLSMFFMASTINNLR